MPSLLRSFEALRARAAFRQKDPRSFADFLLYASKHDAQACAHLAREVMSKRKTV